MMFIESIRPHILLETHFKQGRIYLVPSCWQARYYYFQFSMRPLEQLPCFLKWVSALSVFYG